MPRLGVMEQVTRRTRRLYSAQERQQLVAAWRSSGESAARYGRRVGVNPSNLVRWAATMTDGHEGAPQAVQLAQPGFVELRANSSPLHVPRCGGEEALLEIESVGVRIRVFAGAAPELVAHVMGALGGVRSC